MHHKSLLKVLTAATIVMSLSVPVAQAESAPTNQRNACNFDIPSTDVAGGGPGDPVGHRRLLADGAREYRDPSFDPSLLQGAGPDAGIKPLPHFPINFKAH